MTATRQFLVTLNGYEPGSHDPQTAAGAIGDVLHMNPLVHFGDVHIVPLPNLGADDSDLQISFRALSELAHNGTYLSSTMITTRQAAALVAELSKEKPGRTSHVDLAALYATREVETAYVKHAMHASQRRARIQLIITDAICRCLPEVVA